MDMLPAKNDAFSISASLRPPGSLVGLRRIAALPFSLERASYELIMHSMWLRASNQSEGLYMGIQGRVPIIFDCFKLRVTWDCLNGLCCYRFAMTSVGFGSNSIQNPLFNPQAHMERFLLKYYRAGTLIISLLASFFMLSPSMILVQKTLFMDL